MLELRREVERAVVECLERAALPSRESFERGIRRARGLRVNEVEDRLRLAVVELAVQEGALREFAAPRQTRAGGKARLQNTPRRHRPAVALELDHVLAGIAVRTFEEQDDPFVDMCDSADPDPRSLIPDPCEAFSDAERLTSADPDDSNTTAPGRSGDCGNRVPENHLTPRKNFRISSDVVHASRRLYPSSARSAREIKLMS